MPQRVGEGFDDLGSGVDRDLEPGVEVVGGERWAWWHTRMLVASGESAR